MLLCTAPKETFLDYDLEVYVAEISVFMDRVRDAKSQLQLLWNDAESCASKIARDIRSGYGIRDDVLRQSLKITAINSLYSVLSDKQSKCFSRLFQLHKKGPLEKVLSGIYKPLWEEYEKVFKKELLRLRVNRNNYYAHISKTKQTNEVLSWSKTPGKYSIIKYSDVSSNSNGLFSDNSLNYLQGLVGVISFAQEKEIFNSMTNDINGHLKQFKEMHVLS